MKIISEGERKPAYPGSFHGEVDRESLKAAVSPTDPDMAIFHYGAGAYSKWHSHPGGQSIFVLSESALVGDLNGTVHRLNAGDLVSIAPAERHWHGAESEMPAKLLTLTWGLTRWEDDLPER